MTESKSQGGELSHFEALAAVTPKTQPLAIIIGAALAPIILWIMTLLAPTEAVKELKEAGEQQDQAPVTAPGAEDIEEI